jgi:hypothetical protein
MALLDAAQLADALQALDDGWSGDLKAIKRTVELESFPQAIEAVDRVAVVAEAMDHRTSCHHDRWLTHLYCYFTKRRYRRYNRYYIQKWGQYGSSRGNHF